MDGPGKSDGGNDTIKLSRARIKVWIYICILFLSALTVLLITGYNQIRFNKQIVDYKGQLVNHESEKRLFKSNLDMALDQNKYLKDELENALNRLKAQDQRLCESSCNYASLKAESVMRAKAYEAMMNAVEAYSNSSILKCAAILQVIGSSFNVFLDESASARGVYDYLRRNSGPVAAQMLYMQGLDYFNKDDYVTASRKFRDSLHFSSKEYFSDDCLYFLACCDLRTGNATGAAGKFRSLVWKYPSSNCLKDAEYMIRWHTSRIGVE